MWIWREKYEELLAWKVEAAKQAATAAGYQDLASNLLKQVENERKRAENAIDELLKIKVQADPVSPEALVRQRVNPAEMDNMFEDEDEDAVKRLLERAEAVGVQTIYSEALEEQNES
ncbi:MAG: hypothetical protein V3V32_05335 [Dehalococcoidia bacterium]